MNRNQGFTLIEVLIALAVFAILATITSSAMYYAFNTRSRVTQQAERLVTLQLAVTLVERDVEQAVNRAVRGDGLLMIPAFIGLPQYMEFTRAGLVNPTSREKRSTLKRIALLCRNNQLIRRSWEQLDLTRRNIFEEKMLLDNVSDCRFLYLNKTLQFVPSWRTTVAQKITEKKMPPANNSGPNENPKPAKVVEKAEPVNLPKAVQLTITLADWNEVNFLFVLPAGLYEAKR